MKLSLYFSLFRSTYDKIKWKAPSIFSFPVGRIIHRSKQIDA
ncbi:hypothetical protein BRO54_1721 [Geobacillus proteiniphilus]|uniref:Uncharacterized protein n=1 Tax=Geobacillus proteiniphilus TaxID=860353 RepID=A0A1Q5T1Q2_9BACL|nr:hypothetical protein BRO54_1721 [Geobacillus proteiniphilus]